MRYIENACAFGGSQNLNLKLNCIKVFKCPGGSVQKGGMALLIKPIKKIKQEITVPGDKSISHRAIMLSAIAEGESKIFNFLLGQDCLSTVDCFSKMEVPIEITAKEVKIQGLGLKGLKRPKNVLDVGNSGTTIRLMSGILAGQDFDCQITGDASIQKRPMGRIIAPIKQMGGVIYGSPRENFPPLTIEGGKLKGIKYSMPVASAQVKSAVLLAGLYGEGTTTVAEIQKSRDHTERLLKYLGANLEQKGSAVVLNPTHKLYAKEIYVPGDISSAAFFLVLAAIVKEGQITLQNVGLNPTRTGIIDVLRKMGAKLKIFNQKVVNSEPMGDIFITNSELKGIEIGGTMIPRVIDEIPVIAVAAAFAKGLTIIKNAEELRVKETDRITAIATELKKIGAKIEETKDGLIIQGTGKLTGGEINSYQDHRMAMALAIAGLASQEGVIIDNPQWVEISYPNFFDEIRG